MTIGGVRMVAQRANRDMLDAIAVGMAQDNPCEDSRFTWCDAGVWRDKVELRNCFAPRRRA